MTMLISLVPMLIEFNDVSGGYDCIPFAVLQRVIGQICCSGFREDCCRRSPGQAPETSSEK